MPVAHQDRQRVTLTIPAALFGGRDQKLDFGRRQVFTLAAIFGVGSATYSPAFNRDCSQNSRFRHRSLPLKGAENVACEVQTVRNLPGLRTVRAGSGREGYN
jgi:hypothetical protein